MNEKNITKEEVKLLILIRDEIKGKKRLVINEIRLAKAINVDAGKIYWYLKRLKRMGYIKLYKRVMFKNIITYCEVLYGDIKILKD